MQYAYNAAGGRTTNTRTMARSIYRADPATLTAHLVCTPGGVCTLPKEHDGDLYVGSTDGFLRCITPTGTIQWETMTAGEIRSPPHIHHIYAYVVGGNVLHKCNLATGKLIRSTAMPVSVAGATPVWHNTTMFIFGADATLYHFERGEAIHTYALVEVPSAIVPASPVYVLGGDADAPPGAIDALALAEKVGSMRATPSNVTSPTFAAHMSRMGKAETDTAVHYSQKVQLHDTNGVCKKLHACRLGWDCDALPMGTADSVVAPLCAVKTLPALQYAVAYAFLHADNVVADRDSPSLWINIASGWITRLVTVMTRSPSAALMDHLRLARLFEDACAAFCKYLIASPRSVDEMELAATTMKIAASNLKLNPTEVKLDDEKGIKTLDDDKHEPHSAVRLAMDNVAADLIPLLKGGDDFASVLEVVVATETHVMKYLSFTAKLDSCQYYDDNNKKQPCGPFRTRSGNYNVYFAAVKLGLVTCNLTQGQGLLNQTAWWNGDHILFGWDEGVWEKKPPLANPALTDEGAAVLANRVGTDDTNLRAFCMWDFEHIRQWLLVLEARGCTTIIADVAKSSPPTTCKFTSWLAYMKHKIDTSDYAVVLLFLHDTSSWINRDRMLTLIGYASSHPKLAGILHEKMTRLCRE